jgi:tripartite-type tricarboxylate transporter receptor subunit TctC
MNNFLKIQEKNKAAILQFLLILIFLTSTQYSFSQAKYPSRPIKIVSTFATGTISDITLRTVGQKLGVRLNTQIVIENQTGAGGINAAKSVLSSAHDGYTLALLSNSTAISVSLFKNLSFDPLQDFSPVIGISDFTNVFASNYAKNQSLKTIMERAKSKPGELNIGTTAIGSSNHLTAALFKSMTGLNFTVIPYRSPSDLLIAIQRNDVDMIIQSYGAIKEAILNKQILPLGITSAKRNSSATQIPTLQELGIENFEVVSWNGLFAPKNTPREILAQLGTEISETLKDQDLVKKLNDLGVETRPLSQEELAYRMKSDITKWAKVINDAGIEKQ